MNEYLPELTFSLYLFLSQLSPGPDQTLVTRSSLLYGFRAGAAVTLGISFGIIVHAVLAVTIGSQLLQSAWSSLFYLLASFWLIYLAFKIWPKKAIMQQGYDTVAYAEPPSLGALFKDALLCNLLNPKCTLFLLSLSAPLLVQRTGQGYALFFVALVFVVGGLSWIVWVIAFQWKPLRRFYATNMIWIDRIFSVALLIFGVMLIVNILR